MMKFVIIFFIGWFVLGVLGAGVTYNHFTEKYSAIHYSEESKIVSSEDALNNRCNTAEFAWNMFFLGPLTLITYFIKEVIQGDDETPPIGWKIWWDCKNI